MTSRKWEETGENGNSSLLQYPQREMVGVSSSGALSFSGVIVGEIGGLWVYCRGLLALRQVRPTRARKKGPSLRAFALGAWMLTASDSPEALTIITATHRNGKETVELCFSGLHPSHEFAIIHRLHTAKSCA